MAQQEEDSLRIYRQMGVKSKKWGFTRWLFETVVVMPKPEKKKRLKKPVKLIQPFVAEQDKIIRSVNIWVMDPFGFSVNDTTRRPSAKLEQYGNKAHVTSKAFLIRNQLLFQKGDSVDALKISESERILRQAPYINDARISVKRVPGKAGKDSVDVTVFVQDQWSLIPESGFDPTAPNLIIKDNNFLGLGTSIRQDVAYYGATKGGLIQGEYGIFNIRKSFLSTNLIYRSSNDLSYVGVQLDRPFFSPLTKWAGGISYIRKSTLFFPFEDTAKILRTFPISFDEFDAWVGKSWQFERGKSVEQRSTAFIAGIRVFNANYRKRPDWEVDTFFQNTDQTLVLGSIGISRRQFYKEKYLYRFGANEDVSIGFSLQLIGGQQYREFQEVHLYSGVSAAVGWYRKMAGYIALNLSYANFHQKSDPNRGLIKVNVNSFSNLVRYDNWAFRQFASVNTVVGLNREGFEFINLNGSQMYGFNSDVLKGKSKAILNLETVFYTPYNVFGFRLAPVLLIGLGKIGDTFNQMLTSRIYQAYSIGLLVRNDNLVFRTFELSIGIYPYLPGGNDAYVLNPVRSYRLRVRDFAIPKPELLKYE